MTGAIFKAHKHFLLCFSVTFRAKRAVKIVTARLALISIRRICWGKLFENFTYNMINCKNWYFRRHIVNLINIWILPLFISFLHFDRKSAHNLHCYLMAKLQPTVTNELFNIYGKLKYNQLLRLSKCPTKLRQVTLTRVFPLP